MMFSLAVIHGFALECADTTSAFLQIAPGEAYRNLLLRATPDVAAVPLMATVDWN